MKVYYAHCIAIYHTLQEERDVILLTKLGFDVLNPNASTHKDAADLRNAKNLPVMPYFERLVETCDALAFRALPSGWIPAGITKEIRAAEACGIPVFELPALSMRVIMSVSQTREYLKEVGER